MAYKKKLYKLRPRAAAGETISVRISRQRTAQRACDPVSLEREVRQRLADKVSGNLAGLWLLAAEHLRLGTWDLLCGWTRQTGEFVEPRLALQLVHEAAVCTSGIRSDRTLHNRGGFELLNGLPFVASDVAMHHLLDAHTVQESQRLQVALGQLRRASGHFRGKLLAIDPHRVRSYSKRHMRQRVKESGARPRKQAQTFFVVDADTRQPVCFTTATAARSTVTATPELLLLAADILQPVPGETLVVADAEHFSSELVADVCDVTQFDLLVPFPNQPAYRKRFQAIDAEQFTRHWAGFATAKLPYEFRYGVSRTYWQLVQRFGEREPDFRYKGFLATTDRDELHQLTEDFPRRWHIEEFFNAEQSLGWNRAGTQNLHVRYGQMTMALIAQAVLHQFRRRLGEPYDRWDADHLARDVFFALEGDVRVRHDIIEVTYYNAPHADRLRAHYEDLPARLAEENIDPAVPWLYGYKLDFRFR